MSVVRYLGAGWTAEATFSLTESYARIKESPPETMPRPTRMTGVAFMKVVRLSFSEDSGEGEGSGMDGQHLPILPDFIASPFLPKGLDCLPPKGFPPAMEDS
jgi:hypothetical protein